MIEQLRPMGRVRQCFLNFIYHHVFLGRPGDVAKTVFSCFLHRSLCENHCMLLHVVLLQSSSIFHREFEL